MRTPKECWLTSGHSEAWKSIIGKPEFDPACHHALMILASEMPPTTVPGIPADPYIAIDANSQMFGARRVLAILASLSDPVPKPTTTKAPTLKYD